MLDLHSESRSILVTGGAGYIASHLVDKLVALGHRVTVVDNLSSGKLDFVNPNAKFIKSNIHWNAPEGFVNERPDVIFHLAAVSRTPWAIQEPLYTYETNVVGSANILEFAKQNHVKKVVLASSNIVYAAQTPYKTSKLAMEQVARDYNYLYGLPTLCLRFSNVAGGDVTRQHDENVLKSLARSKKTSGYITITGDGEQTRNFTSVDDICKALILAMESDACGNEIDIMHPRKWSLNQIVPYFNCPVKYVEDRKGDIKHLEMGIGPERARELIGFEATIDLEEYILDYARL